MRRKLNAMALEFVDRNVLIVDGECLLPSWNALTELCIEIQSSVVQHLRKLCKWPKRLGLRRSL